MTSGAIIAKGILLIIMFITIMIFQLYLPTLVKSIILLIYEDENRKSINLSPVQISDIYMFIYYSILIVLVLLICLLIFGFRNSYNETNFVKTILSNLYFDKDNYFGSICIEYITICFMFLILFFVIQIYRYIDNVMLINSHNNNSSLSSTHYGYNPNLYSTDLKKRLFLTEKVKNMLDYSNILYICIPIVAILLIVFKNIFSKNTNLLLNNSNNYSLIFIISILIYIIIAIKSTIVLID
jgi:hypothetical protein